MASKSSTKQDRETTTEEVPGSIVTYTEEEIYIFKDMSSENTRKSTSTSVRRLQSWYLEKHKTELNLDSISTTEAPQLLKHFLLKYDKQEKKTKAKNTSRAHYRRTVMVSEDIFCGVRVLQLLTTLIVRILKKLTPCCE